MFLLPTKKHLFASSCTSFQPTLFNFIYFYLSLAYPGKIEEQKLLLVEDLGQENQIGKSTESLRQFFAFAFAVPSPCVSGAFVDCDFAHIQHNINSQV